MGHNPISASRACQEPFHALRRIYYSRPRTILRGTSSGVGGSWIKPGARLDAVQR